MLQNDDEQVSHNVLQHEKVVFENCPLLQQAKWKKKQSSIKMAYPNNKFAQLPLVPACSL